MNNTTEAELNEVSEDYEQQLHQKDDTIDKLREWIEDFGIPAQQRSEIMQDNLSAMNEREKQWEKEISELKECSVGNIDLYEQLEYDYNDTTAKYQLLVKEYQNVIKCNDQLTDDLRDEKLLSTQAIEQKFRLKNIQSLNERYSSMNDFLMKKETLANEEMNRYREQVRSLEIALKVTVLQLTDIQKQMLLMQENANADNISLPDSADKLTPRTHKHSSLSSRGSMESFTSSDGIFYHEKRKSDEKLHYKLAMTPIVTKNPANIQYFMDEIIKSINDNISQSNVNSRCRSPSIVSDVSVKSTKSASSAKKTAVPLQTVPEFENVDKKIYNSVLYAPRSYNFTKDAFVMKINTPAGKPGVFRMTGDIDGDEKSDGLIVTYTQDVDDYYMYMSNDESASVFSDHQADRIRAEVTLQMENVIEEQQKNKWQLHFDQQRFILDEEILALKRRNLKLLRGRHMNYPLLEDRKSEDEESLLLPKSQRSVNSQPRSGFRYLYDKICCGQAHDIG